MPGDPAPPEMARNSPSPSRAPLESASSIRGAEAEADLEALVELSKLPSNVIEFSHWAFGAGGIPSLQALAYGDFSFEGRFRSENIILCRQTWTIPKWKSNTLRDDKEGERLHFRPIKDSDIKMMELVSENMDFLGACPVDSIVVKS
jgi:hypothetical protein